MNKVLITGLGTARDLGICDACHLDFTWLYKNPSVLLWADELCIPQSAFDIEKARYESKTEKVISMFLSMAEESGTIHKVDFASMYEEKDGDQIYEKMLKESQSLIETFPGTIKKGSEQVPDEIIIEDEGYCGVWMASLYASLRFAKDMNANCLFGEREHNFLKYLYGLDIKRRRDNAINSVYNEIFSLYMPESLAAHQYAFTDEEQCERCVHYTECKTSYLTDTEKSIKRMLEWRDYDELQQAKEEINKIICIKNEILSINDVNDVIKQFREKQNKVNKNINKRFPKIKRWTKMTTVLATPVTIASAITGNIPLTIGSAVATGIAQATDSVMDVYESKHNWVGFVKELENSK